MEYCEYFMSNLDFGITSLKGVSECQRASKNNTWVTYKYHLIRIKKNQKVNI